MDEDPKNNVILTRSESLTMNNRPKDPKTARNKNVDVFVTGSNAKFLSKDVITEFRGRGGGHGRRVRAGLLRPEKA